jgi:hypothetical protein
MPASGVYFPWSAWGFLTVVGVLLGAGMAIGVCVAQKSIGKKENRWPPWDSSLIPLYGNGVEGVRMGGLVAISVGLGGLFKGAFQGVPAIQLGLLLVGVGTALLGGVVLSVRIWGVGKERNDVKIMAVNSLVKFDIDVGCVLAGISAKSCRKDEQVPIIRREFTSSEDGDVLVSRLEQFPSLLLNKVREQHETIIVQSSIDNMVALLRHDKTATIYINSPMKALMQVKKTCDAGQVVYRNDIADVSELVFHDISIPDNVGFMTLFSVGWRKGFFYDLEPLASKDVSRAYDLGQLLGGYYAYLSFQERFKVSDSEWETLLGGGWFPFITLNNELINELLSHNREGWNVDDLLPKVQADVLGRLPEGLKSWATVEAFKPHMEFIAKAAEHYQNDDHLSCISVLILRIEGILRTFQSIQGQPEKAKQHDLAATVLSPTANPKDPHLSPLLPLRFNEYLREVYFANFDPRRTDNALSRNTVGHGVATKENFNLKGSTLGFLILDQLSYYFCGIS